MVNDKPMPMVKLRLKVKIPKAIYDALIKWGIDNELEGTLEQALEGGVKLQVAQLYKNSQQSNANLVDADGSPLNVPPGGVSDA